jgi:hypothetical protein
VAKDFRDVNSGDGVMADDDPQKALIDECNRQSENCAYSATTFIIWLRVLCIIRLFCVVTPILFGALAAWKVMTDSPAWAATRILLATAIPPAYRASGTDKIITDYRTLAGEMTNLRDRFRHAANIDSNKPFAEFDVTTKPLLDRLEKARARSLTPPEWCFRRARKKHRRVITFTITTSLLRPHEHECSLIRRTKSRWNRYTRFSQMRMICLR